MHPTSRCIFVVEKKLKKQKGHEKLTEKRAKKNLL